MIDINISDKVLTISGPYNPPMGGIAQVVDSYSKFVFSPFYFFNRKVGTNKLHSLWIILSSSLNLFIYLLFHRNIRIVHIHSASGKSFRFSMCLAKIAKCHECKVVMHIHGGGFVKTYENNPQKIRTQLKSCDAIISLTNTWSTFFKESVGLENVFVVNNIVEPAQINLKSKGNKIIHFLFLGKICKNKGIYDLIEVLGEHQSEFRGKMVLHIGGNGETERIENLIKKHEISDFVFLEGWVSGKKKKELLNLMDVFVLPSYIEGLPISILEAFSYGKTVITTTVGGIPEIVNRSNGMLFTPGSLDELYSCVHKVICNPSIIEELGQEGQKSIIKNQPDNVARQLSEIYKVLLNE